jgi:hypothetical protein
MLPPVTHFLSWSSVPRMGSSATETSLKCRFPDFGDISVCTGVCVPRTYAETSGLFWGTLLDPSFLGRLLPHSAGGQHSPLSLPLWGMAGNGGGQSI